MPRVVLEVLNVFFFLFHTCLVVFNVAGWAWKRTRLWNLYSLGLTAFSWFLMGIWYGTGYCVCTDLHFRVRETLGIHDNADNYLQLLARHVLGLDPSPAMVRQIAGLVFGLCLVASITLNVRDRFSSSAARTRDFRF
jgi:hypothetical protein